MTGWKKGAYWKHEKEIAMKTFIRSPRHIVAHKIGIWILIVLAGVMVHAALGAPGYADDFFDTLKKANEKLQQLQGQSPQTPPSPQATPAAAPQDASQPTGSQDGGNVLEVAANAASPAENSGTPEATAAIAKSVGKYDVMGIKLGMPVKEAVAILQARSLQFKPETVKYDVLPNPLTYGLYAVNQVLSRNSGLPPGAEKVYLMLTMPPNEQMVSKINRFLMFTKETAPTQQVLAGELVKKYGPVSFDSAPGDLYRAGVRDMFWVDDAQGTRLKDQVNASGGTSDMINNCRGKVTFSSAQGSGENQNTPVAAHEIQADPVSVKIGLEQGYAAPPRMGLAVCGVHTIIHARLFYGYPIGISSPDVVGALLVVVGSGPLDRSATDATHTYLMQAAKMREIKEKEGAQKNRPAL
jgi:hypothetical protein